MVEAHGAGVSVRSWTDDQGERSSYELLSCDIDTRHLSSCRASGGRDVARNARYARLSKQARARAEILLP